MNARIRMLESVWRRVRAYHLDPAVGRERISYMFGRTVRGADGSCTIIVAEPPVLMGDDCYIRQSGGHVALDPTVRNAILASFARSDCDVLLNCHDHHFAARATTFSPIDDADDLDTERYLRDVFEPMLRRNPAIGKWRRILNVSLVMDQSACDARYMDGTGRFLPIGSIDLIGQRAHRIIPNSHRLRDPMPDERFIRHADFISAESQRLIAELTFALAGCGGLGSVAAEALFRLGARRFVLIDHDRLEMHNLNRWQGGTSAAIGKYKVSILARRLKAMAGDDPVVIHAARDSIFGKTGRDALKRADVIIGGLDNHLARYFLNRFSVQYLVPFFDAGVSIRAGTEIDFQSRYVAVIPGTTACMECSAYTLIARDQVERELRDEVTAAERKAAGYVDGSPEVTSSASAYALNLRAVATLVMELQNWVCGFRPLATCALERWRDAKVQRSDRHNHPDELPDPSCPSCGAVLGLADQIELPCARPEGHAARILERARTKLRRAS